MVRQQATESVGRDALTQLVEAARALDIRAFEECDDVACREALLPRVEQLLEDAIGVAQRLADHFDDPDAPPAPPGSLRESIRPGANGNPADGASVRPSAHFHTQIDALVVDSSRGPALVADIAFVASLELREKRQRLVRVAARPHEDHWELVEACASARRRVLKSATALELVLCEVERREPALDYRTERATALEVRRRYAALRRTIAPENPPDETELLGRMRVIGTRIAMLVGLDVYPDLRLRDRVEMRALQARILEWLAGEQDTREGIRLWGDLVGFADLIGQVKKRQELLEHDAELIGTLGPLLSAMEPGDQVTGGCFARLIQLRGASDEVDALLDAREPSVGCWKRALDNLTQGEREHGGDVPAWPDAGHGFEQVEGGVRR